MSERLNLLNIFELITRSHGGAHAFRTSLKRAPSQKSASATGLLRRRLMVSQSARAHTLNQSFAASTALYGWLLRKKVGGWRHGSWQRRFYARDRCGCEPFTPTPCFSTSVERTPGACVSSEKEHHRYGRERRS